MTANERTSHGTACKDKTGTVTGYRRHQRRGEPTCGPCREAKRLLSQRLRGEARGSKPPARFDLDATKRALDRYLQARRERKQKEGGAK